MIIIGGGLAGLSTGCYAQMNGWNPVIVEHSDQLGGVCTAWRRGAYNIDGCIHWLMGASPGGWLRDVYEELGIVPQVPLRTIELFERYEHHDGWAIDVGRDLAALAAQLRELSPADHDAIERLFEGIHELSALRMPRDAPEVRPLGERLRWLWDHRNLVRPVLHVHGSVGDWIRHHVRGARLRDFLEHFLHPDMPMLFVAMLLGQLGAGQLTRPAGGSGRFRDALVTRYRGLGGRVHTGSTVDEILIEGGRATGVMLSDGRQLRADVVVSTASAPETVLRLLGGRHGDAALWRRLERWPTFEPIVLVSAGVARPLAELPPALVVRQAEPFDVGGRSLDALYLRVYNDEPEAAPPGATVVQTMLNSSWDHWADLDDDYGAEKERVVARVLERMERRIPGLRAAVEVTDIATPRTFWRCARSWRGAFEGWMPTTETLRSHPAKSIPGLDDLYFAGQWVEPGGGVPTALLSGRQLVQILCERRELPFVAPLPLAASLVTPSSAAAEAVQSPPP